MRSSDFVNHSYDYRLNWTPLSPVTITNIKNNILILSACCLLQVILLYGEGYFLRLTAV